MTVDLDEQESQEQVKRVMFATDNWEDSIRESVWFGQKIPQKRRIFGRGAQNITKDPILVFFEDNIVLTECRNTLLMISEDYTESSKFQEREWEE